MLKKVPFLDTPGRRRLLFFGYLLLIAAASLTPTDSSALPVRHIDKAGHFLAYVLMAVLALVCFEGKRQRVTAVLLTFVIAFLLEWGQLYVPGRLATLTDGITNYLGLLGGILLYRLYYRRFENG